MPDVRKDYLRMPPEGRAPKAAAPPPVEAPLPESPPTARPPTEGADEMLASIGKALMELAGEKGQQEKAITQLADMLGKLSPKDYPALAANESIQAFIEKMAEQKASASDDPPGTIYNRGTLAEHKKPWSWRDLKDAETVTFTPNETRLLVWNGLALTVVAEQENTVPAIFYGVYLESVRATKFGREHMEWLMRKRDGPTHPDMVSPDGVRARSTADQGWYQPGAGSIAGAAPPEAAGAEEGKGGEAA